MRERLADLTKQRKKSHARLMALKSPVYAAFLDMEKAAYADRALPKMTKELIAVGISVVIDCQSCMQWHIEQAKADGGELRAGAGGRGGRHRNGRRPGHGLGPLRPGGHGQLYRPGD